MSQASQYCYLGSVLKDLLSESTFTAAVTARCFHAQRDRLFLLPRGNLRTLTMKSLLLSFCRTTGFNRNDLLAAPFTRTPLLSCLLSLHATKASTAQLQLQ